MVKLLLINSCLNFCEYLLVYLVRTFIIWEFKNPFQWIIDMPNYSQETRGAILFSIFLWQIVQLISLNSIYSDFIKKRATHKIK